MKIPRFYYNIENNFLKKVSQTNFTKYYLNMNRKKST